jgi:hypothetical protein
MAAHSLPLIASGRTRTPIGPLTQVLIKGMIGMWESRVDAEQ